MSARKGSAEWALRRAEIAAASRDRLAGQARRCKWWQCRKREDLFAQSEAQRREALSMVALSAELDGERVGLRLRVESEGLL